MCLPLLTTKLHLLPCLSRLPGLGFWEMTRPVFTFVEKARLVLPTEQWCAVIARLAALRVLPFTFGTTQAFGFGLRTVNVALALARPGPKELRRWVPGTLVGMLTVVAISPDPLAVTVARRAAFVHLSEQSHFS